MLTSHRHWRCANTTHPWLAVRMPLSTVWYIDTFLLCQFSMRFASSPCIWMQSKVMNGAHGAGLASKRQNKKHILPELQVARHQNKGNPFPPRNSTLAYLPREITSNIWNLCRYHVELVWHFHCYPGLWESFFACGFFQNALELPPLARQPVVMLQDLPGCWG